MGFPTYNEQHFKTLNFVSCSTLSMIPVAIFQTRLLLDPNYNLIDFAAQKFPVTWLMCTFGLYLAYLILLRTRLETLNNCFQYMKFLLFISYLFILKFNFF